MRCDGVDRGSEKGVMFTNRKEIYVEQEDCDPGGIVHYRRYLEYGTSCTNALFERAGLSKRQMLETYGIAEIPIVEVRAQIHALSQFGDTIVVAGQLNAFTGFQGRIVVEELGTDSQVSRN